MLSPGRYYQNWQQRRKIEFSPYNQESKTKQNKKADKNRNEIELNWTQERNRKKKKGKNHTEMKTKIHGTQRIYLHGNIRAEEQPKEYKWDKENSQRYLRESVWYRRQVKDIQFMYKIID